MVCRSRANKTDGQWASACSLTCAMRYSPLQELPVAFSIRTKPATSFRASTVIRTSSTSSFSVADAAHQQPVHDHRRRDCHPHYQASAWRRRSCCRPSASCFSRRLSVPDPPQNAASLQATGGMSAEISESLNNFKVIVAFNRRDCLPPQIRQRTQGITGRRCVPASPTTSSFRSTDCRLISRC